MFDPERLLGSLLSDGLAGRPGRTLRRTALSPQGLMVLGGVAIAAYEHFVGQKQQPPAAPAGPTPMMPPATPPPPPQGTWHGEGSYTPAAPRPEAQVLTLIAAMANAAKVDGHVDDDERARSLARLAEIGVGDQERAFLEDELVKPLDLDGLVARVQGPVEAAEVYAASVAAIVADTLAEQGYLALLASRLGLPPALVQDIHARIAAARGAAQNGEGQTS
jgi:uncharacterized membrane protein YebE (DUF533 family)